MPIWLSHLKGKVTERKGETQRERDPLLVHSPKGLNWARPETKYGSPSESPVWEAQVFGSSSATVPGAETENWSKSGSSRTQTRVHMATSVSLLNSLLHNSRLLRPIFKLQKFWNFSEFLSFLGSSRNLKIPSAVSSRSWWNPCTWKKDSISLFSLSPSVFPLSLLFFLVFEDFLSETISKVSVEISRFKHQNDIHFWIKST